MTPPLQLVDGAVVVSPTQLATMQLCPTYWKHNYLYRRVASGTHAARDGGSAIDSALNTRYTLCGSLPVTPVIEQEMLVKIDAGFEGLDLPLDEYRTAARYKDVVQAYNAHYMAEDHEVLGVQVEFEVPLGMVATSLTLEGEIAVRLRGIVDRLIRTPDGHVRVVDTKTANKFNGWAEFRNSGQLKGYCYALPRWFATQPDPKWTGIKAVHGAMVDLVVIRPPYKGGEARKPKSTDTPRTEFLRMEFNYSEERLEEWRADSLALVRQALGWVAADHFPQHERACSHQWGKPCPYIDVCTVPTSQREMVLATDMFTDYKRDDEPEEETQP